MFQLTRDLTQEETAIIVAAWDYKFIPILILKYANMYDEMQDVELDIDPEVVETATIDMNKWHSIDGVMKCLVKDGTMDCIIAKAKKHTCIKRLGFINESRRSPQFSNKEIS